jgi:hypothetical protein
MRHRRANADSAACENYNGDRNRYHVTFLLRRAAIVHSRGEGLGKSSPACLIEFTVSHD